ncbi:MAG: hypothetical protein ABDH31_01210 [Chlorobiota bacterium]
MELPWLYRAALLSVLWVGTSGCQAVRQVTEALVGVERLQFRLDGITDVRLAGISLGQKQRISDFSAVEAAQLLASYRARSLPVDFVLQVAVRNPNDGIAGRRQLPIRLAAMEWRLLLDEVPTIRGALAQPVEIAGGAETLLPLQIRVDLVEFFQQRQYEDMLRLALELGQGQLSRVSLDVQPTLQTPVGEIRYPRPVRVVAAEFRP